jgi:pimeloyl-ACP methyl ester carboxylesterase
VCGIVTISPAVPCDRPEVRGALSAQFRLTAFLATRLPKVLLAMQRSAFNKTSGANGQQLMIKRMRRISPADVPVVSDPENFADLVRTMTEGRRQGIYGGDEFALMTRPWGFDPAASAVPCTLIHGADDPLTPAIARWASNAPNVVVRQVAGGHLLTATGEGRAAVIDALGSTCG